MRCKALKLGTPVSRQRLRANNQHGIPIFGSTTCDQHHDQGDALHRFAKTHLVPQDPTPPCLNQRIHPAHPEQLVGTQAGTEISQLGKHRGLVGEACLLVEVASLEIAGMQGTDARAVRCELQRHVAKRVLEFLHTLQIQKVLFAIFPLH